MSWAEHRLGDVVKFRSGGTPSKSEQRYWDGDIPWLSSKDLTELRIYDAPLHVTEVGVENGTRLMPENTVMFVVRGMSLATEFRVSITRRPCTFNQDLKAVECGEEILPDFLFYSLFAQRDRIKGMAGEASHGTKKLESHTIENIRVALPDLDTQRRVIELASAYDDLIENNRRRIALLEEAARILFREWFVRFRFPGHEHVNIIDGVPEGWERQTLGAIAETNRESYSAKELPDEINYIDISSVTRGRITSKALTRAEAPGRARRKARDGDIIWSNVRPNLRAYALILEPEENDVFSTGFTVLTAKKVPFTWLYLFVTTDSFVGHLVNHATGAGYPAVRPDDFERATLVVPPKALLTHFHEATESNFRLIAKLYLQNAKLAQARDVLLPRLMNDELVV